MSETRYGPFVISVNPNEGGEDDYTQIGIHLINEDDGDSEVRGVVWIDDFEGKPSVYLHHDEKHETYPLIFEITRRT